MIIQLYRMKKIVVLFTCLFVFKSILFSQETVKVNWVRNNRGGYSFTATNYSKINYVIHLYFTSIDNLTSSIRLPYDGDVKPGTNYLFELTPDNPLLATDFNYKFNNFRGYLKPLIDTNYPYLLPVNNGRIVTAKLTQTADHIEDIRYIMDSLSRMKIKARIKTFETPQISYYLDSSVRKLVSFELNYGDTVYAARKGRIYSVTIPDKLVSENDSFYARGANLEIYQKDCSFAMYKGIHNAFVEVGQDVQAGQPIALAGVLTNTSKATLTFSVSYYDDRNRFKIDSGTIPFSFNYTFINPMFCTKEGLISLLEDGKTYTALHPETVITKEMSKREFKQWKKKRP